MQWTQRTLMSGLERMLKASGRSYGEITKKGFSRFA
jgi:hypothetical protein